MREKSLKRCESCSPSLMHYEKTDTGKNHRISPCSHGNMTHCSLII